MSQEIPLFQVDAFTTRPFGGNPAAVCPLDGWLPDAVMQGIAAENNLSETAFLVKRGADYDLRWFTPAIEVDLCGHATLASAYIVATHLDPAAARMVFHTRSGALIVTRDDELFTLDLPSDPAERQSDDGVSRRLTRAVASEALAEELAVDSRRGDVVDDPQRRLGQRAGLVETDHVDGGKRLDCVQLLRERATTSHSKGCEGEVRLMSKIKPSGISVTTAATEVVTASLASVSRSNSA